MSLAARARQRLRLHVEAAAGQVSVLAVERGPINVGRGQDCAIVVDETAVSRNHCVLFPLGGALHLKDLRSANGTFVNGERVTHRVLAPGDVIGVGSVRITVRAVESEEETAEPVDLSMPLVDALGALMLGSRDLSASARAAVGLLQQLVPAERSYILLSTESEAGQLPVLAKAHAERQSASAPEPSANLAYDVLRLGEPFYAADASTHPRLGGELRGRAVMCAPIEAGGETLGVVYSESAAGDLVPDEELESLFEGIAAQVGSSLAEAAGRVRRAAGVALAAARAEEQERGRPGAGAASGEELARRCDAMHRLATGLARDAARLTSQLARAVEAQATSADDPEMAAVARRVAFTQANRLTSLARAHKLALDLEMGEIQLQSDEVDVAQYLIATAARLRDEAKLGRASIGFSSIDEPSMAVVDRELLGLVVDTLGSLSVYFTSPGGTVTIGCLSEGGTVEIVIAERGGSGSTDERLRTIMAWNNAAVPDASELGALLTFCRLAVEAQGGTLSLDGDRERTTWSVVLPSTGADEGDETLVVKRPMSRLLGKPVFR